MKILSNLLVASFLLMQSLTLHAVERHAFVVGNSAYDGPNALVNPSNDAADMAEVLTELGYKIFNDGPLSDLTRVEFEQLYQQFTNQLPEDSIALVYYAGHGTASDNDNFLIPIGAELVYQDNLPDRAVSVRSLIGHLSRNNRTGLNIFLLDACRDNMLEARGFEIGLQRLGKLPLGTFIGYAAAEGQLAAEGTGRRNGIYTGELIKAIRTSPDKPIELVHKSISERVLEITDEKQFPVFDQRFARELCFGVCGKTDSPTQTLLLEQTPTDDKADKNITAEPRINPWIAVAGVVVVGALLASRGSSGGGDNSQSTFRVVVDPPDQ